MLGREGYTENLDVISKMPLALTNGSEIIAIQTRLNNQLIL